MKKIIEKNRHSFLIVNICLVLIVVFSSLVIIYDDLLIDTVIYEFLINNFSSDFVDEFMINVTKLGDTKFVMIFTCVMFLIFLFSIKKGLLSFIFMLSVSGIAFINQILKFSVRRIRPDVNRLIEIGGYSFPSGHSMVSMVLYGLIAYIAYKVVKIKWLRNGIIFINVLVILLIGVSRIYLGVHFFSDIIVGYLVSIVFLVIIINILEKRVFSQN